MTIHRTNLHERIFQVVRQIPPGTVSTYGQVAAIVGDCTAREVGFAMSALSTSDTVTPWQRIINAKGQISPRGGGGSLIQRELLEAEGVTFDSSDSTDFNLFGWRGPSAAWLAEHNFNPAPPLINRGRGAQLSLF